VTPLVAYRSGDVRVSAQLLRPANVVSHQERARRELS